MKIRERLKCLIKIYNFSPQELEKRTGLKAHIWGNLLTSKQRVNEDHIEAIEKIWPQYIYWIITGKTLKDAGQTSPDLPNNKQQKKERGNETDEQTNNHNSITNKHYNHPKHEETNRQDKQ